MDEFAQSREDDDLFADEFEAVAEPVVSVENPRPVIDQSRTPEVEGGRESTQDVRAATGNQQGPHNGGRGGQRQGQGDRGQGSREQGDRRGRGGARSGQSAGLGASRYATNSPESNPAPATNSTPPQPSTAAPTTLPTTQEDIKDIPSTPTKPTLPTEPIASMRTPAVRGDRSATGGPAHKKLTEEELTAKMEKMAILNAQKAERHRLSEADQAAFQHREKELAKERKEKAVAEKRNERAMEMERAKNRERKMKAQGVREWDSEKVESDIVDGRSKGRSSEYVRGGHGGVIRGGGGLGTSRYATAEDSTEAVEQVPRGRGDRGGRGARGGRGGGRGGKASITAVPTAEDFPSLPTVAKPVTLPANSSTSPPSTASATENVTSPMAEKGSHDWAEEMATPVEEKKVEL